VLGAQRGELGLAAIDLVDQLGDRALLGRGDRGDPVLGLLADVAQLAEQLVRAPG